MLTQYFLTQVRTTSTTYHLVPDIKCCSDDDRDKFKFIGNLLYFEKHLNNQEGSIRLQILQIYYAFLAARHFGFTKTLELISWGFWLPQMWKVVKHFVLYCDTYFRLKNTRHCLYRFLQPLQTSHGLWFLWISSLIYYHHDRLIPYLWLFIIWQKWHILSHVRRQLSEKRQEGFFWIIFIDIIDY